MYRLLLISFLYFSLTTWTMASIVVKQENVYGYSLNQWANAIYLAEGGSNAQYPYGIRSVKCQGQEECRKVCVRTIKNNAKRYKNYGYRKYPSFIQFLGSRFCPTEGRNLSKSEKCLNGNWQKNVLYFLERNK